MLADISDAAALFLALSMTLLAAAFLVGGAVVVVKASGRTVPRRLALAAALLGVLAAIDAAILLGVVG